MGGTTVAQAIPIAISPILTRLYKPEEFGVFALFIAIVGIFSSVISGRYEQALLLPKRDENAVNILFLGFFINVVLSSFLAIIISLFQVEISSFFTDQVSSEVLYAIPLTVFLVGTFNLLNYYSNRKEYYKEIAKATVIKSILVAAIQLGMGYFKSGVFGLVSAQITAQFFANLQFLKKLLREKKLLSSFSLVKMFFLAKKYKDFPKFQAPHALIGVVSNNMPIYLFTLFFNTTVLGLFALSIRIVLTPMSLISSSIAKVYNQKIAQMYVNKEDTYSFTLSMLLNIFKKLILPFLLFIYFAPEIFAFIFSSEWREAGVYTQILAPWLFISFFTSLIIYIGSLLNLQKRLFLVEVVTMLLRTFALGIGIYYKDIYIALALFSFVGFIMAGYNLLYLLNALKMQRVSQ